MLSKLEGIEVVDDHTIKFTTKEPFAPFKQAINHTTDIYDEAFVQIKCGMTEKEIGQLFVEGMKKRGVQAAVYRYL